MIWQSPVTDHSLSSDQIYTNTPSPKGNTMHINTMLSSCSSHTIVHLRHVHIYSFLLTIVTQISILIYWSYHFNMLNVHKFIMSTLIGKIE